MAEKWLYVLLLFEGFSGISSINTHNISLYVNVINSFYVAELGLYLPVAHIHEINGDPREWIRTSSVNDHQIRVDPVVDIFQGLDYTYVNSGLYNTTTLFWTSVMDSNVVGMPLRGNMQTFNVYNGTSSSVAEIAIDWLAGNIYWADPLYNWIAMTKTGQYLEGFYTVIANTNLDSPHGIAVYPSKGLLFWTDRGAEPKIERSSLSGKNRITLLDHDMQTPQGLCIDYENDIIYWVDSGKGSVEKMNLDGKERDEIYQNQRTMSPFAVTLYQNLIFVSDHKTNRIAILNTDDKPLTDFISITLGTRSSVPYGISVVHETRRPVPHESDCKSKHCEDFCVSEANGEESCLCRHGKHLQADGRSCSDFDRYHPPFLLYTHGWTVCQLPANFPDHYEDLSNTDCILSVSHDNVYGALAFNIYAERLYVVDESPVSYIVSHGLSEDSNNFRISGGFGKIGDMAVDWKSSLLYWTDSIMNHIKVSKLTGHYHHVLLDSLDNPRGLAVDPFARYLYWSSGGSTSPANIKRSSLDGSNPTIFVHSENRGQPNGLTIDFPEKRLYWADSIMDGIFSVDLQTGRLFKTIYTSSANTAMFAITTFQDYVIWTDQSANHSVHAATKEGTRTIILTQFNGAIHDIITYDYTKQPLTSDTGYNGNSSCLIKNGGCSQLCLPNTSGHKCACGQGYHLGGNNMTCVSDVINDKFLLFTDSGQKAMYQISLETQEYHAIPLNSHDWPFALDYDHIEHKVYWSDRSSSPPVIKRAYLNGTDEEVIYNFNNDARPIGIAIDMISRVIYVAENNANQILVMKLDGSLPRSLIVTERPWDLTVDPINGYMYWTGSQEHSAYVKRAYMDGSNAEKIYAFPRDINAPKGITIDASGNYVYFADSHYSKIQKISLTSPYPSEVVVQNADLSASLVNDVAIHGEYVYYADYSERGFVRNKTTTGIEHKAERFGPHVFGVINDIVIYDSQTVRSGTNECSMNNGNCSHMCLARPNGRTCFCEVGIELKPDGRTCADAGWDSWGKWSTCTKQCGKGKQTRQRRCINPPAGNTGMTCPGDAEETRSCNTHPCPVNGGWAQWEAWSECTKTCDSGEQKRQRICTKPDGKGCVGTSVESQSCNTNNCVSGPNNPDRSTGMEHPANSTALIVGVLAGALIVVAIVVVIGILACRRMKYKTRLRMARESTRRLDPLGDDVPDYAPPSYSDPDYTSPGFQACGYQLDQSSDKETKVPLDDDIYEKIDHIHLDTTLQTVQMVTNPTYSQPFPVQQTAGEKHISTVSSTVSGGVNFSTVHVDEAGELQ